MLLNWYSAETERDPVRLERMNRILRDAYRLGCNILISNFNEEILTGEEPEKERRIDIWWQGDATGRMSLLLAYLMQRSGFWEDARLSVITAEERHRTDAGREALAREIEEARIAAELVVLTQPGVQQAAERSAQSDFVFLPFRFGRDRITSLFGRPAHELLRWMPATVLIQAAEDIDLDAEPESGEVAERAEALDALTDAARRAEKAAKTAEEKATIRRQGPGKTGRAQGRGIPRGRGRAARGREGGAERFTGGGKGGPQGGQGPGEKRAGGQRGRGARPRPGSGRGTFRGRRG